MPRILLAGFAGSMGQQVVKLVENLPNFEITAGLAHRLKSSDPADYGLPASAKLYTSLDEIPADAADIWVDFTVPASVYQNVRYALENGYRPIIGTTGLTDQQEAELKQLAKEKGTGGLIAPNFGMSAVLLMKFAQEAAKYFPDVEIIEMHHEDKKDAPSGTALATAKLIAEVREQLVGLTRWCAKPYTSIFSRRSSAERRRSYLYEYTARRIPAAAVNGVPARPIE